MQRKGRYYLSRVVKLGLLNQDTLMAAIADSATVNLGKFTWAITDVHDGRKAKAPFIFGKLSKYSRKGHVKKVDEEKKIQRDELTPNLLVASAPFIYLPQFSGLAYLHVWNEIQADVFPSRFKTIIEQTHEQMFVECIVEAVSDYREFASRLKELDLVQGITARVNPPNPLFGHLWRSLKEYIKERNADEIRIQESREGGKGLNTRIVELVESVGEGSAQLQIESPSLTDAAILMAADGYGYGKVTGPIDGVEATVRTSDAQHSFPFAKEPEPAALAAEAHAKFAKISKDRKMKH